MKKYIYFVFCVFFVVGLYSQPPEPYAINALSGNSTESVISYGVAIDSESNVYYTGVFEGVATFGETELTSQGLSDTFIAKTDSSGSFLWAVRAGGVSSVNANAIVIDGDDNIYIAGTFSGTSVFGDKTVLSNGAQDAFLAKYNTDGDCLWAINAGSNDADYGTDIDVDNSGNIILIGNFQKTIDFGNSVSLTASGFQESFVAKYNSNGVCQWAVQIEGNSFDFSSNNAVVTNNSDFFITGTFYGKADFGNSIELNSATNNDVYLARYNSNGLCQWANHYKGENAGDVTFSYDIAADEESNIYFSGYYSGSLIFDETKTIYSNADEDLFVCSIDEDGSFRWGHGYGSAGYENATSIAVGKYLFLGGIYTGTLAFSPEINLTSNGNEDVFMAVFTKEGSVMAAYSAGSTEVDYLFDIIADENNFGYITGSYENDISFGNSIELTNNGKEDAFFTKLNMMPVIISTIEYNLLSGWNYISVGVMPEDISIDMIFSDIESDLVIVMNNHNGIYIPALNINTIGELNNEHVYSVYVANNAYFEITGEEVSPEDYNFSLNEGWNFLPYLRNAEMLPEDAFGSIIDNLVIVIDDKGQFYIPDAFNTIGNLKTGSGYKVYLNNPVSFTYPQN